MSRLLPEEREALEFFSHLDLTVHHIASGPRMSPEFFVDGDGRGYVVEVKARRDSKEWDRTLRAGDAAYQVRATGFGRWAEDITRKAMKQMQSADPNHARFWVLWLSIECRASRQAMFEQAIGSLFGVRQVVDLGSDREEKPMWNCLFAQPGVFEKHSEIVAVLVSIEDSITLCVNEFAKDHDEFRESLVYHSFARIHPPISATDLAENRGFLEIKDPSVDRKNNQSVADYLARRYSLMNPILLDMKEHLASIKVPKKTVK